MRLRERLPIRTAARAAPAAALALLLPLLSGCLYAGGRTVREHGPQISPEVVAMLEPGETSSEWLVATFGEPQARTRLADGREILRYDTEVRTTEGSYVLMLVASSSNTIERTCWWFELCDDRICRVWGECCGPIEVGAGTAPAQVAGASSASPVPPADLTPTVE